MKNGNSIVYGIVTIVMATLVCATLVLLFAPDGTDVAPIIGTLAPTVAALAALAQVQRVNTRMERVDRRTEDLTNGLMDAKIRAGVVDAISDGYEGSPQHRADEHRREVAAGAAADLD